MMYVFDTNSLRVFGNYYPEVFGRFWEHIEGCVAEGRLGSVREVKKELDAQDASVHLGEWVARNEALFPSPTSEEMQIVADILRVPHFQQLIGEKQRLRGYPVADPFLVARAASMGACVITEEALKPNAAKVPNVCQHFGVQCTNVQGFLTGEGWRF